MDNDICDRLQQIQKNINIQFKYKQQINFSNKGEKLSLRFEIIQSQIK